VEKNEEYNEAARSISRRGLVVEPRHGDKVFLADVAGLVQAASPTR
jgi:hypothetical protein